MIKKCHKCRKYKETAINPKTEMAFHCCDECRAKRNARRTKTLVCQECKSGFQTQRKRQAYCSEYCQREAWNRYKRQRRRKQKQLEMRAGWECERCKYRVYCDKIVNTLAPTPCQAELVDLQVRRMEALYPINHVQVVIGGAG